MNRSKTLVTSILSAFVLLTASTTTYAARKPIPNFPNDLPPLKTFPKQVTKNDKARLDAARANAAAEAKGQVTASTLSETSNSWTSKYTLYVGCTTSPAGKTYSTIQGALAVALPYTTIKVCPGTYLTGGGGGGIDVTQSYILIEGTLTHSGDETINCVSGPNPTNDSWGLWLEGNYDEVKNMTISDCEFGLYIGTLSESKGSVVDSDYFNDDYNGVDVYYGDDVTIENSYFQTNYYPIYTDYDVKDVITGNTIEGDGNFDDDGIFVQFGVSAKIESNTVNASEFGLDFEDINSEATIESNHFDGDAIGFYAINDNSGNLIEKNYSTGNYLAGFLSDDTEGADATPDSGPNKFEKNQAYGNGVYDYFDDTVGYTGNDNTTNAGTADYYIGNKGNSAYPGAIFFQ